MGLKNSIMHVAGKLMVERPGKSKSYELRYLSTHATIESKRLK